MTGPTTGPAAGLPTGGTADDQKSPPAQSSMPGWRIPLGRWAGVPIYAHWTVLFTLALFGELLAAVELPSARPGHSAGAYWAAGVITAAVFLVTLLAHELAHAVVARHYGVKVVSITLWMLGGMTELDGEPPTPRADAAIAAAGPLVSLVLGAIGFEIAATVGHDGLAGGALVWLAAVNILLGVFNLLPGSPLDGGRLLRALVWWRVHDRARAVAVAGRAGKILGYSMMVFGVLEAMGGAAGGLWLALIGWFIAGSSAGETEAARTERLRDLRAGQVVGAPIAVLPEWWTVAQCVEALTPELLRQPICPLVDFSGRISGALTLRDLDTVPVAQRPDTRLRDIPAARRRRPLVVTREELLTDMLTPIRLRGGVAVVVDEDRRPVGLITSADLARATDLAALGWRQHQDQ